MPDFPHLKLNSVLDGLHRSKGGGNKTINPKTAYNLNNRSEHAAFLKQRIESLQSVWASVIKEREDAGLPPLPDAVPLFLEIDPNVSSWMQTTWA